jgi:AGZA family xanthine/uracil permease-like MFS transporter
VPGGNNFASEPISAAVAMGVPAMTKNPFIGMVAGILVRYIGKHFGLPV